MSVTNETEVRCPNCGSECYLLEIQNQARSAVLRFRCDVYGRMSLSAPAECRHEITVRVTW